MDTRVVRTRHTVTHSTWFDPPATVKPTSRRRVVMVFRPDQDGEDMFELHHIED